jgi:hypothetical protein
MQLLLILILICNNKVILNGPYLHFYCDSVNTSALIACTSNCIFKQGSYYGSFIAYDACICQEFRPCFSHVVQLPNFIEEYRSAQPQDSEQALHLLKIFCDPYGVVVLKYL